MTVQEFRKKVKPFVKLSIDNKDFLVEEVVKFRFDPVRKAEKSRLFDHSKNSELKLNVNSSSSEIYKKEILEDGLSNGVDDGSFYIKCFLSDNYVFADDLENNMFLLVKEVKTLFVQPFAKELEFDAKEFKFLFSAHAVAEEVMGKEILKKGYAERFWDYKSEDDSYLSLGIEDDSGKRLDFYGKIFDNNTVVIHDNTL